MTPPYGQHDPFSPSEDLFSHSGTSFFYSDLNNFDNWNRSIPSDFVPATPSLTAPSDTSSETAPSELLDMSDPTWPQGSLSMEWNAPTAQDHSILPQQHKSPGDWQSQGHAVTTQGLQALDTAAWLSVPQGTVASGSSPLLSQEGQSSYTLPSESDQFQLPSWEFNFTAPQWNPSGPMVYTGSEVTSPSSTCGVMATYAPHGYGADCSGVSAPPLYPDAHPPMFFPQDGHLAQQRQPVSQHQHAPARPIMSRNESATTTSTRSAPEPRHVSRPQIQGSRSSDDVMASVSNVSGSNQGMAQRNNSASHMAGYMQAMPQDIRPSESGQYHMSGPMQPSLMSYGPSGPSMSVGSYTQSQDTMFPFGLQEQVTSPGAMSLPSAFEGQYHMPAHPGNFTASSHSVSEGMMPSYESGKDAQAVRMEREEAKARTHEYYSASPREDGLYHCPFVDQEPSCRHKPVKLKCAHDKYIDSHLKPFVCKLASCAEQRFSSTACLLRHEREAHGMHGHGERPHLCWYEGCDRALPGNGFPRRFNAFDHMKRVHGLEVKSTKVAGQKRGKLTAASGSEPPAQKRKVVSQGSQRPRAVRPQAENDQPQPPRGGAAMARTTSRKPRMQQPQPQWTGQPGVSYADLGGMPAMDDQQMMFPRRG